MHRHFYDIRDVVVFAQALIGFVFAGTAAVALAVAAHALQSTAAALARSTDPEDLPRGIRRRLDSSH